MQTMPVEHMSATNIRVGSRVTCPLRRLAAAGFIAAGDAGEAQCQSETSYGWDERLLPTVCPLVARKFSASSAKWVMRALADDGLGIIPQQQQAGQRGRVSASLVSGRAV